MANRKPTDLSIVKKKRPAQSQALKSDAEGLPNRRIDGFLTTLDQVDFFNLNPRTQENSEFESIKESIRNAGLKNRLSVTKRPGDDLFILSDGGNTRLRALKELYDETGDKQFYNLTVDYTPFTSDSDLIIRHMVENEERGDMIFYDRANAAHRIKTEWEKENSGKKLSARKLVEICKEKGWSKINLNNSALYTFCVEMLSENMPNCLESGIGKTKIADIRKHNTSIKTYANFMLDKGLDEETALNIWYETLKAADDPDTFNVELCWSQYADRLARLLEMSLAEVETQLNHIHEHNQPYDGKVKYIEVTPAETPAPPTSEASKSTSLGDIEDKQEKAPARTDNSILATQDIDQAYSPEFEQVSENQLNQIETPQKLNMGSVVIRLHPLINGSADLLELVVPDAISPPFFQIKEEPLMMQFDHTMKKVESFTLSDRYTYYRLVVMWITYKRYITAEYSDNDLHERHLIQALRRLSIFQPLECLLMHCSGFVESDPRMNEYAQLGLKEHIDHFRLIEANFDRLIRRA